MLRTGVDFIEIGRIDEAILRHGDRFFHRFFTTQELIDANGRTPALAARFAAKEAVAKALGCGIGDVGWKEIEIDKTTEGYDMIASYEAEQPFIANVYLLVKFDKTVSVPQ